MQQVKQKYKIESYINHFGGLNWFVLECIAVEVAP